MTPEATEKAFRIVRVIAGVCIGIAGILVGTKIALVKPS